MLCPTVILNIIMMGINKGLFNVCCGVSYIYIICFMLFVFAFQIFHRILALKQRIAVDFFLFIRLKRPKTFNVCLKNTKYSYSFIVCSVYVYVVCAIVVSCDRFTFGIVFFRLVSIQSVSNFEHVCIVSVVCAVSFSRFSRKFSSVKFEFSVEKRVVVNQKQNSFEKSAQSLERSNSVRFENV